MLVRLHPYHPPLGYVLRTLTTLDPPNRFQEKSGWYDIADDVAEKLRKIPQQDRYPTGPRAFMIAEDAEEAREMDEAFQNMILKARKEEPVGTPDAPVKRPGAKKRKAASKKAGTPKARTRKKKAAATDDDD